MTTEYSLRLLALGAALLFSACESAPSRDASAAPERYDLILRNGTIYDGSGGSLLTGDVAIAKGRITAVGQLSYAAREEIDVGSMAVAPGFAADVVVRSGNDPRPRRV